MAVLLSKFGREVLSLNARTLQYINRVNAPEAIRLAHHKLDTKRQLQKAGVPTPRLFATIENRGRLRRFAWTKLPSSFVLKPNSSFGGGGIIVIFGRNRKGNWVKADKTEIFIPELRSGVLDILDGNFSRGNVPDIAFFEQRVKNHPDLKHYSVKGIPDIRVLVYNSFPIMAMLRLPTEESGGRANLHAGGIGVGIDLAQGLTTTAIYKGRLIDHLPQQRLSLSGIRLPYWSDILLIAVKAAQASGLRFTGVDIALDREDGPLVLEVNARPGLAIQLANMTPLRTRLRRVEGLTVNKPERAVRLALNLFSSDIEQEIEDLSGRTILAVEEEITIYSHDGQPHKLLAKIDTGAYRTAIDTELAKRHGLDKIIIDEAKVRGALGQHTRPIAEVTLKIRDQTIKTNASLVDRSHMNYQIIIGRRDLKGFLVDPTKLRRPKPDRPQADRTPAPEPSQAAPVKVSS